MVKVRQFRRITTRRLAAFAALVALSSLGACAAGDDSGGRSNDAAPNLNCQFGSPCADRGGRGP
jgi:hypothetical protein